MSRERYQRGYVQLTGKRTKKWKGHWFEYRKTEGGEVRIHRAPILGLKAKMSKAQAQKKLQEIIDAACGNVKPLPEEMTLGEFITKRYLPMKESSWRHKQPARNAIENHIIKPLGHLSVTAVDKFVIQMHMNKMAESGYSKGLIIQVKTHLKAALTEALEAGLISGLPGKLKTPQTKDGCHRSYTEDEVARILAACSGQDRLIVNLFIRCGFRPGELFGLRWNDVGQGTLRIDETVVSGVARLEGKTPGSLGYVLIPPSIQAEIEMWREQSLRNEPDDWMFTRPRNGKPWTALAFWRFRLQPLEKRCGVEGLTLQGFRRTFATLGQKFGNVKDIQAQLRHSTPNMTARVYMQPVQESVRKMVDALDAHLSNCSQMFTKGTVTH